jgi:hypothetical protein
VKVSKKSRRGFFILLLVVFLFIWMYLGMNMVTDWQPFSKESQPHKIFSYQSSISEYKATIHGLQYPPTSFTTSPPTQPYLFKLVDLLQAWNPDAVSELGWINSVAHPLRQQHVARFDFSKPDQQLLALQYRDAEIPFILENVPEIVNITDNAFEFEKLLKNFGSVPRMVEKSVDNHFMYYTMKRGVDSTLKVRISFPLRHLSIYLTVCQYIYIYHSIHLVCQLGASTTRGSDDILQVPEGSGASRGCERGGGGGGGNGGGLQRKGDRQKELVALLEYKCWRGVLMMVLVDDDHDNLVAVVFFSSSGLSTAMVESCISHVH